MMAKPISHHLSEELLWDYARGNCNFGEALVLQTHLLMCQDCQSNLSTLEAGCGTLFEDIEGIAMGETALELALARIELRDNSPAKLNAANPELYGYSLPKNLDGIKVQKRHYLGPDVWIAPITKPQPNDRSQAYFLFVKEGMSMLQHTHTKREMTLVLHGGFSDGSAHYEKGDINICDENISHAPAIFDEGGCLSLVYQDGPIRPQSLFGHLLKPFARI